MTHEEIIAMAREAGFEVHERKQQVRVGVDALLGIDSTDKLDRFAVLVAAKEREAWRASLEPAFRGRMGSEQVREIVQSAIRARGQKDGA